MKLIFPAFSTELSWEENHIVSLVIEHPRAMFEFVNSLKQQEQGLDGNIILSDGNKVIPIEKNIELFESFFAFDINKKTLLTKITNALEQNALSESHYEETLSFLQKTNDYFNNLTFDYPIEVSFPKITVGSLLKACGLELDNEFDSLGEQILKYMELIREFDHNKIFVLYNLRSIMQDNELGLFFESVESHDFRILLIDNIEKPLMKNEKRIIIDRDLCEITAKNV